MNMKPTNFNEQCQMLQSVASKVIEAVMTEGRYKGYSGEWMDADEKEHMQHAEDHAMSHRCGDKKENHMTHAAVRALMACWVELSRSGNA